MIITEVGPTVVAIGGIHDPTGRRRCVVSRLAWRNGALWRAYSRMKARHRLHASKLVGVRGYRALGGGHVGIRIRDPARGRSCGIQKAELCAGVGEMAEWVVLVKGRVGD
ncbi:unnamed protein product [Dovyalis caffra]|uniref:Uncharacterized protein n=1 Tax=Dovyalis caffra TaxID=77055 RepID=A0AAV1QMD8_9ROSI|nr:unnamed protein product [Dovyalis caffra]